MNGLKIKGSDENVRIGKIICIGQNYRGHAREMKSSAPEIPYFFFKPASAVIGNDEEIILPSMSKCVHHEVELAVVISRRGKRISKERTFEHILGYAILIDITARDLQDKAKAGKRPFDLSKSFDTFCPISEITLKEEIDDPNDLAIKLWVNDELRQSSNTKEMIFYIDEIIKFLSEIMTLEHGDVIATGTPEGVGEIREGDVITASITGLGSLRVGVRRE